MPMLSVADHMDLHRRAELYRGAAQREVDAGSFSYRGSATT
jgi:hypothetical protein